MSDNGKPKFATGKWSEIDHPKKLFEQSSLIAPKSKITQKEEF